MTIQKGFSLIELVLAMAILAILASSSTVILTSALKTTERALLTTKVRTEGTYLTEAVSKLARFAPRVTCPSASSLQISSANPAVEDALLSCVSSGTPALGAIASGSADLTPPLTAINSNEVDVTGCSFTCTSTSIQFDFSIADKDHVVTPITFNTEIVLRNNQ